MTKITTTITAVSIHREDANPIYGEGVTYVKLADEGAGAFIEIGQTDNERELRFDIDELELVAAEARKLINNYGKNNLT